MKFARCSVPFAELQSQLSADSIPIAIGSDEPNTQAGSSAPISKEFQRCRVLGDHQIRAAVVVKVRHRRAALFAVYREPADGCGHGLEVAPAISTQPQAAPAIVTPGLTIDREAVLTEENVFVPIAVEVGYDRRKRGGQLRH